MATDFSKFVQDVVSQARSGEITTGGSFNMDRAVRSIIIETAYGPKLEIQSPLADQPGAASFLTKLMQPKISLNFSNGLPPLTLAPYGNPPPTKWPYIATGALVGGVLLAWLVGRGATCHR